MLKRLLSVFLILTVMYGCTVTSFAADQEKTEQIKTGTIDTDNPYRVILPGKASADSGSSNGSRKVRKAGALLQSGQTSLPASYDSRTTGCITPVKNQGQTGTCWAHAVMACLEAYDVKHGYKTLDEADYSESHLVWYTWNPVDSRGIGALDGVNNGGNAYFLGGNWICASSSLSEMSGINNESDYLPVTETPNGFDDIKDRYSHTSGRILNEGIRLTSADDVKRWIIDNGAAAVGFCSDAQNYMYRNSQRIYSYYTGVKTQDETNHNVTIVGWDDNWSADNFNPDNMPPAGGAWLIKDSWGPAFNNGYYWLSYYEPSLNDFAGYTTKSAEDYLNNYSYCSSYFSTYLTSETNLGTYETASEANVFTAKNNEYVDAVSFWTMQENVTATVSIYKNLSASYTDPTRGTLAASFSVSANGIGYHTFAVPEPVRVNRNSLFSVCVQLTALPAPAVYIPVEYNGNSPCTVHQKESYIKLGSDWYDLTTFGYGNVYVKAQTKCVHDYVEETRSSTCEEDGYSRTYCTVCGKILSEDIIPASGHFFDLIQTVSPTCTEYGCEIYGCRYCTEGFSVDILPIGHSYSVSGGRYESQGHTAFTEYTCSGCGDTYVESRYEYRRVITLAELLLVMKAAVVRLFDRIFGR